MLAFSQEVPMRFPPPTEGEGRVGGRRASLHMGSLSP